MAKAIAIINQKGGVGKTTTSIQLGAILHRAGFRVLMVDMDPQANLSTVMNADLSQPSILDALLDNDRIDDIIQHKEDGDIVISNGNLSSYDMRFTGVEKEYRFKEVLDPLRDQYDFIIVDSPPALGTLMVSILTAVDSFVIPANVDIFSMEGIKQLYDTYLAVKKYTNPNLNPEGILITRYIDDEESNLIEKMLELGNQLNIPVFNAIIYETSVIRNSISSKQSLLSYGPNTKSLKNYADFVLELTKKMKGDEQTWQ